MDWGPAVGSNGQGDDAMSLMKTAIDLDREIAESYIDKFVTVDVPLIPTRRVTGVVKKIDDTLTAKQVMLWIELPNGQLIHAFLTEVVPEVPRATVRRAKSI
jgi:hypothetical protein